MLRATVHLCLGWAWGILPLTCVWLAVPSARQRNSTSSKAIIIYYYFIDITGRTVLFLDSLPLISLLRLLLPISSNFKMCGFQRSSIHVPSFGEAFWYYSFVVIRISLLHVYNKSPLGVGEEILKGSTAKALNLILLINTKTVHSCLSNLVGVHLYMYT